MAPIYREKLYAVHFLGSEHEEDCVPYLFEATLLPIGGEVKCSKYGCDGTWTLCETKDASEALVREIRPGVGH